MAAAGGQLFRGRGGWGLSLARSEMEHEAGLGGFPETEHVPLSPQLQPGGWGGGGGRACLQSQASLGPLYGLNPVVPPDKHLTETFNKEEDRSFPVDQWVKDPAWSLRWPWFDPWPGNGHLLWAWPKKKKNNGG